MITETNTFIENLAEKFRVLGQPARLKILLAIGKNDACVCHLEAWLGYRQAYISQQLMQLRDAGMVSAVRSGKHIYYSVVDPSLLDLIYQTSRLAGYPAETDLLPAPVPVQGCICPRCNPGAAEDGSAEEPLSTFIA